MLEHLRGNCQYRFHPDGHRRDQSHAARTHSQPQSRASGTSRSSSPFQRRESGHKQHKCPSRGRLKPMPRCKMRSHVTHLLQHPRPLYSRQKNAPHHPDRPYLLVCFLGGCRDTFLDIYFSCLITLRLRQVAPIIGHFSHWANRVR